VTEENKNLGYAWYVVALCTLAYIFSFIDRQILALLIEPIKADLAISDTQFSLLHGLAFSLFYATMGIPIARLADRKSRPIIISAGILIWSVMTVLCGVGRTFAHLFITRIGVGVGEAALTPATYSMIRDLFPRNKLGLAYSVYSVGTLIGGALAYLIGGTAIRLIEAMEIAQWLGLGDMAYWRVTFFIVGLPGVLIALIFLLTVRDPQRKGLSQENTEAQPSFADVLRFIRSHQRSFVGIYLGSTCYAVAFFDIMSWTPALLIRKFEMSAYQVGIYMGSYMLVFGTAGILFAGWLIDWFHRRGRDDGALFTMVLGSLGLIVPMVCYPLMADRLWTLVLLAPALFFGGFCVPASTAAMQLLAPNQMRAQISAIFLFINSIVAVGIGTTLVALCTDYIFGSDLAVGKSMALVGGLACMATFVLVVSSLKDYKDSVALMRGSE
jgi:MFS family permease